MSRYEGLHQRYCDEYCETRKKSKDMYQAASMVMPGGDTRTATYFYPYPHFIENGQGAYMYDVDGNKMLDFQNNYTSLIHGHGHKGIAEAVSRQVVRGSAYTAPFALQTKLARILVEKYPSIDTVRFTNSGTEANMHALRAARAYTGKAKIIKIEGGYHGTTDVFEASVDPNIKNAGTLDSIKVIPESRGVSANALKDVIVVPFNDIQRTKKAVEENAAEVACFIIEPVMGSAGQIQPKREYLNFLRKITEENNIVLIFDEVVTGRYGYSGAQGVYDIVPDMTTLGKIVGGGMPVGAFGGKTEIMEMYDPKKKQMYHSGTFNGNAITVAAGIAALEAYPKEEADRIEALAHKLRSGIVEKAMKCGIKLLVTGHGSIINTVFTDLEEVVQYRDVASSYEKLNKLLFMGLLLKDVFIAERGMFCTSTAMTEEDIDFAVEQIGKTLEELRPVIEEEAPELVI